MALFISYAIIKSMKKIFFIINPVRNKIFNGAERRIPLEKPSLSGWGIISNGIKLSIFIVIPLMGMFFVFNLRAIAAEPSSGEILQQKRAEMARLEQEIAEYAKIIEDSKKKGKTLQKEIVVFEAKIKKAQTQIKGLGLAIRELEGEIKKTESEITEKVKVLNARKAILAVSVRNLDREERTPFLNILAANESFFEFFNNLYVINNTREELRKIVLEVEGARRQLEEKKGDLNEQYDDQSSAKKLLEISKKTLEQREAEKKGLLRETKGQETKFQELLSLSRKNLDKLKSELSYLLKAGISAEDALKYGQAVANGVGLRPAFLLAILEIESHLGANVGTGT